MLVLTRKLGEMIMIGNNIQLKIISLNPQNVILGISAPRNIIVHRQEIFDRIKTTENKTKITFKNQKTFTDSSIEIGNR